MERVYIIAILAFVAVALVALVLLRDRITKGGIHMSRDEISGEFEANGQPKSPGASSPDGISNVRQIGNPLVWVQYRLQRLSGVWQIGSGRIVVGSKLDEPPDRRKR